LDFDDFTVSIKVYQMKNTLALLFITLTSLGIISCSSSNRQESESDGIDFEKIYSVAQNHYTNELNANPDINKLPRSLKANDSVRYVSPEDWTSGFFPGSLWYIYEYTGKDKWKDAAAKRTESLEAQKNNRGTHDVGFMIYCSYGNGYRFAKNEKYKDVIIEASKSLISRYKDSIGLIKSWDWGGERWQHPVIVDNMMNLEMLFFASRITGDSVYYKVAKAHAMNTMKNHFREDNSSFHVVDYDTVTYGVRKKQTWQGASDSSSWARGQAWGLYGFTVAFRETGDSSFLKQAEKIAAYIMGNKSTPADNIPYWDYKAVNIPNEAKDASAAAITASALLELQNYIPAKKEECLSYAQTILKTLSSDEYLAEPGTNGNFLLKHSTGSRPENSEVNTAINYADYYFLEALSRYRKLK
jgi:unsaturated chondroitin disaccharide hydrolase